MAFCKKHMVHRLIPIATVVLGAAVAIVWLAWPLPSAGEVMQDFLHNDSDRAEDMLMDPLILHSDTVKHAVIEGVKNPKMQKRRYAIAFLGVARVNDALPALRRILADNEEEEYFRGDALTSIYQIARDEGISLAKRYKGRGDYLGRTARQVIDGTVDCFERSYLKALIGVHE